MALISCPECDREISQAARSCPACGCPRRLFGAPGERARATLVKVRREVGVREQGTPVTTLVRAGIAAVLVCWMGLELVEDPRWQVAVPHALTLLVALPARQLTVVAGWCAVTFGIAVVMEEHWRLVVLSSAVLAAGALLDATRARRTAALDRSSV